MTKKITKVSAPGKLFLSGEHSVVYGEPALLTAIDQRCQVNIVCGEAPRIEIESQGFKPRVDYSTKEILEFTKLSRKLWKQFFKTKDKKFLQEIHKEPLSVVLIAIGEALTYIDQKEGGLKVRISSQIPPGSGLGSSASIAVGVVKGVLESFGKKVSLEELNKIAYEVEKRQHGFPSGGDNSVVVFGGFLRFQKIDNQFQLEQIRNVYSEQLPPFLLLQSGQPAESTGEMVAQVRERYEANSSKVGKIIEDIGVVTTRFLDRLKSGKFEEFATLIRSNERLLEKLGVVGKQGQKIIQGIEELGGVAKICGAGGVKTGSGILLTYHPEPAKLAAFGKKEELDIFGVKLGEEGVRVEKSK